MTRTECKIAIQEAKWSFLLWTAGFTGQVCKAILAIGRISVVSPSFSVIWAPFSLQEYFRPNALIRQRTYWDPDSCCPQPLKNRRRKRTQARTSVEARRTKKESQGKIPNKYWTEEIKIINMTFPKYDSHAQTRRCPVMRETIYLWGKTVLLCSRARTLETGDKANASSLWDTLFY